MKLLCIGNSITLHAPAPDIGWSGNWGMAASCRENDYAHQLARRLEEAGKTVTLRTVNLVSLEREPETFAPAALGEGPDFTPDVVVIRLGENVAGPERYDAYIRGYGALIDRLLVQRAPYVFAVGNFWARDDLDEKTAALAKEKGVPFVSLKAAQGEANEAIGKFEHKGVAAHPSDKGMAAIADTIFAAFREHGVLHSVNVPPFPIGEPRFAGYRVLLDGKETPLYAARVSAVPFNTVWPGHQRPLAQTELAAFLSFDLYSAVDVTVIMEKEPADVVIRPLSKGIKAEIEGKTIRFTLREAGQYSVEADGRHHNLHIFANAPADYEEDGKKADYAFGPGVHHLKERLKLNSGENLYIAPGAVVYGELEATDAENVRVFGGGILDGSEVKRQTDGFGDVRFDGLVHFTRCENVTMEGVILRDSALWTATCINCRNVRFHNVKVIGMWRYNSDGFDFVNSQNVRVADCFLRTFDDTIVLKGLCLGDRTVEKMNVENVLVENCVLWCDWGGAMEVGAETVCDEYVNIAWKNCDIIRTDQGAMRLHCDDRAFVHNVSYDDIRVEYSKYDRKAVYQRSDDMVYDPGSEPAHDDLFRAGLNCGIWSPDGIPGQIRDVSLRNIKVYKDPEVPMPEIHLNGYDDAHTIARVRIKNVTLNGEAILPEVFHNSYVTAIETEK